MKEAYESDNEIDNDVSERNKHYEMMNESHDIQTKFIVGGIAFPDEVQKFFENLDAINSQDKKFDNYVIAYIDFLGVSKKMNGDDSFDSLQILKFLLFGSKRTAKYISSVNEVGDYIIKIFSDNVVIAQKLEKEKSGDQIISIINLIINLQFEAAIQFDFWLRGGITVGELFIDNSVVWGRGLIEAYEMESKLAIYPRVIISDNLLKAYERCHKVTLNLYALIKRDFDGLWYLDFLLAVPNINNIPIISDVLKRIRESYENKENSVKQKFNWVINYFNNSCYNFKERVDNCESYILPLLDLND